MAKGRDKAIGRYLAEVADLAPGIRARLTIGAGELATTVEDLGRVRPIRLREVGDTSAIVLRPKWPTGTRTRDVEERRELERRYKPIHWIVQSGVPLGSSVVDLERLAKKGARWLSGSGVRPDDVILGFLPAGPHLPYWQLVLGARELGVSTFHVPPIPRPVDAARLLPTVAVGRPSDLARLLAPAGSRGDPERDWRAQLRVVIAAGEALDDGLRARLHSALVPGTTLVSAWAPPGARVMWWECAGGTDLHTWPEAELVQIADPLSGTPVPAGADGEVIWTALGWFGSVLVRLRTGVFASLDPDPCPACGQPGPRLTVASGEPSYLRVLDRHPGVARWQVELRTVDGFEELLVFLTPTAGTRLPSLLAELDGDLGATQYVVLDAHALDDRLADHGDQRVLDSRI